MAGFGRRSKPLKAGTAITEVGGVSLEALADGDLLIYDSTNEAFLNGKTLPGSYVVTGTLTTDDLVASGDTTLGGALTLAGNATLAGTLAVTGSLTAAALSGTSLVLTESATIAGNITATGSLSVGESDFTGAALFEGDLRVVGDTRLEAVQAVTLTVTGSLTATLPSVMSSDLSVGGGLTVAGAITTAATLSAPALGSSGTLSASGATTLGSTLTVSGAATLASTLAVTGATTLSAALTGTTAAFTGTVRSEGILTTGTTAGVHMELDTDEVKWYNGASFVGQMGMTTAGIWYVQVGSPLENIIGGFKDGQVDLYYNNVLSLSTTSTGAKTTGAHQITGALDHDGTTAGFYNTTPAVKQTVTGSRGGNAALASLLTALATIGLLTDSSSA